MTKKILFYRKGNRHIEKIYEVCYLNDSDLSLFVGYTKLDYGVTQREVLLSL